MKRRTAKWCASRCWTRGKTDTGALAGLLAANGVNVLICGGIGAGARQALAANRIGLVAGASGSTDDAVQAYLAGELSDNPAASATTTTKAGNTPAVPAAAATITQRNKKQTPGAFPGAFFVSGFCLAGLGGDETGEKFRRRYSKRPQLNLLGWFL